MPTNGPTEDPNREGSLNREGESFEADFGKRIASSLKNLINDYDAFTYTLTFSRLRGVSEEELQVLNGIAERLGFDPLTRESREPNAVKFGDFFAALVAKETAGIERVRGLPGAGEKQGGIDSYLSRALVRKHVAAECLKIGDAQAVLSFDALDEMGRSFANVCGCISAQLDASKNSDLEGQIAKLAMEHSWVHVSHLRYLT